MRSIARSGAHRAGEVRTDGAWAGYYRPVRPASESPAPPSEEFPVSVLQFNSLPYLGSRRRHVGGWTSPVYPSQGPHWNTFYNVRYVAPVEIRLHSKSSLRELALPQRRPLEAQGCPRRSSCGNLTITFEVGRRRKS